MANRELVLKHAELQEEMMKMRMRKMRKKGCEM